MGAEMMIVLIMGLLSLVSFDGTQSCGIMTHITLAQRASTNFEAETNGVNYRDLILKHPDAFQAGNPFPDTFYNSLCKSGSFHSVSEDTHWTPFANATVNYLRRKYPQPWTEEAEKLVAFLFGAVAHSVSDTSWHSLGIQQGFLRAMSKANYHNNYGKAHSAGDFGGDVVNVVELDTSDVGFLDTWYIPTADLVEIYKEFYGWSRMDASTINECAIWMYLGRAGENLGVIDVLYPMYSEGSPFLVDRMQDYFLGGMDDMAAWTTNGWRNVIHMIDNGPESCTLPDNPLYVKCGEDVHRNHFKTPESNKKVERLDAGTNNKHYIRKVIGGLDQNLVEVERTERGLYIKATDKLQRMLKEKLSAQYSRGQAALEGKTVEEMKNSVQAGEKQSPMAFYDTSKSYSKLGRSLGSADVNGDGFIDLIVGAPGHGVRGNQLQGRVYIVHGTADGLPNKNLTLDTEADVILEGIEKDGMFGHDLVVADMNADGINDLVVSAPSVGSPELTYHGEVYVFHGLKSGGLSNKPDLTLKCSQVYCNLGWSLASSDVNGDGFADIIIGAPFAPAGGEQNGFAAAVFAKAVRGSDVLLESSFDWMATGDMKYAWFGYDVSASKDNVVVGAPTRRICIWSDCSYDAGDVQGAGQVSIYKTPLTAATTVWRIFTGTKEYDYMGANVQLGNFAGRQNVFGFSLPTKNVGFLVDTKQAGVTRVYEVSATTGVTKIVEYKGKRAYARFGMVSWFEDVTADGVSDILIGSPHWTDGTGFHSGALQGRVYVFDGSKAGGNINDPDIELHYAEDKSKFGTAITTVKNGNNVNIVVAAPGSNAYAKLGGRLAIFSK